MICERTEEMLKFFEEDKEAVFFSSKEELEEKVTYYLDNDIERNKIAKLGKLRAYSSGYDINSVINKHVIPYL
jgi:spore maturation protein CgeB